MEQACAVSRRLQGSVAALTKADLSPVTVADFAAQAVVSCRLTRDLGAVCIVGEESGDLLRDPAHEPETRAALEAIRDSLPHDRYWHNASPADLIAAVDLGAGRQTGDEFWTLDPIDGTKGFLRGQQYCIALALIRDGIPAIGVLGCPNLRRDQDDGFVNSGGGVILTAVTGAGTTVSDPSGARCEPARVRARADPVVLVSSLVENDEVTRATARVLERLPEGSRRIRIDSQAKYALVAMGLADAFLRLPLARKKPESIWDHAAGVVVCSEAGGIVTDARGRVLDFGAGMTLSRNRGVIAAGPDLHRELAAVLADLGLDAG